MSENNKNNCLITVTGIQEIDGEEDRIELTTVGSYMTNSLGHTFISYKEYDEENPAISTNNVVKVESDDKVTIIRKGETQTRLILEKDKRHQCFYRTIMGDLMIGVYTDSINNELSDKGGKLHVSYELSFNNEFLSKNEFYIDIKEKG